MTRPKLFAGLRNSYLSSTKSEYTDRFFVSWLLPRWLIFAFRTVIAIYMFTVQFFILGYDSTHGHDRAAREDFAYFTVLTYWGMAFYFAFSAAHTASYAVRGEAWLSNWPRVLRWLHSVLYATVTIYPFIVTAVFWAALATGAFDTTFTTWSNISEHALNSVLCFLEILLPTTAPHPWINIIPLIVILSCYLGLAYLVQAVDGFFVYDFLNPKNGRGLVAGACIGILAATLVLFVIIRYLIWLRIWVTERKLGLDKRLPSCTGHVARRGDIDIDGEAGKTSLSLNQAAVLPSKAP